MSSFEPHLSFSWLPFTAPWFPLSFHASPLSFSASPHEFQCFALEFQCFALCFQCFALCNPVRSRPSRPRSRLEPASKIGSPQLKSIKKHTTFPSGRGTLNVISFDQEKSCQNLIGPPRFSIPKSIEKKLKKSASTESRAAIWHDLTPPNDFLPIENYRSDRSDLFRTDFYFCLLKTIKVIGRKNSLFKKLPLIVSITFNIPFFFTFFNKSLIGSITFNRIKFSLFLFSEPKTKGREPKTTGEAWKTTGEAWKTLGPWTKNKGPWTKISWPWTEIRWPWTENNRTVNQN